MLKKQKSFDTVKKTVSYFFPIAWKIYKGYFIFGLLQVIINALAPFAAILISPLIIDELIGERNIEKLIIYTVILVVGGAALNLLKSILSIILNKYSEKFNNYFTEKMSRRVMELDFQLTEDKNALDQIEKARDGMGWYSGGIDGIFQQIFSLISSSVTIIGVVALIFINAPLFFVISGVILLINSVINSKNNKIEIESYQKISTLNRIVGYLGWEITDFRYGKDIRLYDAADMMTEKWRSFNTNCMKSWKWKSNKQLSLDIISVVANAAKDFGSYFYFGILVITGKISIGVFSQMISAGATFQNSMQNLILSVQGLIKRSHYAYEYVKFMDYPEAIQKGSLHIKDIPHTIEFRNVKFTYPNTDVKVLDGINITLNQGEHLSVVGLNGTGKTTFIKLMCRLYDPTDGEILLDGVNIKEYDYKEYMSLFSPVFQDFKLFSFSVKENVVLNGECEADHFENLTGQVGIADKIKSFEKKEDTILFKAFDENGVEPSGGEQQKIAIARALYKNSPIVILDEPTAALDPVAEYDIYRKFDTLVGEKTSIYISHRLSSCKFCDRIAVFSDGKIKECGTHEELVSIAGGIYNEMFAAQAQYYN